VTLSASGTDALLRRIDAYLDAAPRSACRPVEVGPFTIFLNDGPGWRYYARPTGGVASVSRHDVEALRARQRELGQPESIEWVEELVPSLGEAATRAGLSVASHPLLRLDEVRESHALSGIDVRLVEPDDDLAVVQAVAAIAFSNPGTAAGPQDERELADVAAGAPQDVLAFVADRMARGLTVTAAAFVDGVPVSVGSHQPVAGATEIVGVGTLPAFRRKGLGAAVTSFLVRDALDRGVETVVLSAGDDLIADVYRRVGFVDVGHAGAAEPAT
jgi:GNAT superfamily N-acetyltransferase